MSAIDDLPPLREVVQEFDLAPKKQLGQNFLFDLNLTSRIARASGRLEGARVLEVGPGPGGLTRALLAGGAAHVVAVERDARCLPALAQIAERYPGRLTVVEADATAFDPRPLLESGPGEGRPRIVANLPYNVGTQLLTGWVAARDWPPFWESLTLMFQREVAERIVATPDEREDYGRLGVLCGWRTQAHILFDVSPSAFVPPPKVTSSIVQLTPRETPEPCDVRALEAVTGAAFGQRRKMLRQSLKAVGVDPAALCEAAGVPPTARAEEVGVSGFVAMANALGTLRGV
ncbi:16S rRNA (adenine(1518)-N(6)/adenine(1519)-N(6))-dimethyltransferase RsmA [Salinarimonas ramus]|uniref:Ribosomal RNA small subunit methyltransferase A n=1 Tax=Salinarimonas ramus TaxID=690164 RepID=A0A917Q6W5_9HYPH|nr:16S rRNA (adenine(1518)-N(6)/adenine(1519)-N(6))-dimethyltransferase RsmA [Salinarimonas ramus]GGK31686.1 ribosomal RNA small subunit methyltransferase A [Salinarimonas ramus]